MAAHTLLLLWTSSGNFLYNYNQIMKNGFMFAQNICWSVLCNHILMYLVVKKVVGDIGYSRFRTKCLVYFVLRNW
jgi:hypothetical protein